MTDQHPTAARTSVVTDDVPTELTTPLPDDATLPTRVARAVSATATGVSGVHRLGGLVANAADRLRERIGRSAGAPGVRADTAEDGVSLVVDVSIVVDYPRSVTEVADAVRTQAEHAVAQLTTTPVEVRVRVVDVHGPFDRDVEPADLVNSAAEAVQDTAARTAAATKDTVARAGSAASQAADATSNAASQAADATSNAASQAADATRNAAERSADATQDTGARVADASRAAAARTSEAAIAMSDQAVEHAGRAVDAAGTATATAAATVRDAGEGLRVRSADAAASAADAAATAAESAAATAEAAAATAADAATTAETAATRRSPGRP
ncbi:Asp23/Gls24 family envelope stress response protein [Curtobacterium sp. RRHDQ10]|uniref:Asp23/Gls24 family envelope stress response protein n=1 Tax=Curtobacterium phyllosphaerae TaxID=3413379 RepID=UPI003BF0210B